MEMLCSFGWLPGHFNVVVRMFLVVAMALTLCCWWLSGPCCVVFKNILNSFSLLPCSCYSVLGDFQDVTKQLRMAAMANLCVVRMF